MIVEVSLKHFLMRAEMCFDATMEGWRVGYCDMPVVVPLMQCYPLSYGLGLAAIRAAAAEVHRELLYLLARLLVDHDLA